MIINGLSKNKFPLKIAYHYLTLIDKPIDSLSLNSIIEGSAQILQFGFYHMNLGPETSCLIGGVLLRLGIHLMTSFITKMKIKNPQKLLLNKIVDKVLREDFRRDCKFYDFEQSIIKRLEKYYSLQQIVRTSIHGYLIINILRGCYYILQNQPHFLSSTLFFPSLALYDPLFLMPILIIMTNLLIIKKSKHPFLIHHVQPHNFLYCLNIAFIGGLPFVVVPSIYQLTYLGISIGHLLIRMLNNLKYKQ